MKLKKTRANQISCFWFFQMNGEEKKIFSWNELDKVFRYFCVGVDMQWCGFGPLSSNFFMRYGILFGLQQWNEFLFAFVHSSLLVYYLNSWYPTIWWSLLKIWSFCFIIYFKNNKSIHHKHTSVLFIQLGFASFVWQF